jgi:hypothetical protein
VFISLGSTLGHFDNALVQGVEELIYDRMPVPSLTLRGQNNRSTSSAQHNLHIVARQMLMRPNADSLRALTSRFGKPALQIAAQNGSVEMLKVLLKGTPKSPSTLEDSYTHREAYIHCKTLNGTTALSIAMEEGHTETVQVLIEQEALQGIRTDNNKMTSPFQMARLLRREKGVDTKRSWSLWPHTD